MNSLSDKDCYDVTRDQLISILQSTIISAFNDELNNVKVTQNKPPFTEFECRVMKLPRLKYEVNTRGLIVVGTGKGGAAKKKNYVEALMGRQKTRKMVRSFR